MTSRYRKGDLAHAGVIDRTAAMVATADRFISPPSLSRIIQSTSQPARSRYSHLQWMLSLGIDSGADVRKDCAPWRTGREYGKRQGGHRVRHEHRRFRNCGIFSRAAGSRGRMPNGGMRELWRARTNSRGRPGAVVRQHHLSNRGIANRRTGAARGVGPVCRSPANPLSPLMLHRPVRASGRFFPAGVTITDILAVWRVE